MRRVLLAIVAAAGASACAHGTIGEQTQAVPASAAQGGTAVMMGERAVFLQDDALRALLSDAIVAAHQGGDDGPFELFLPNGVYQRGSGWGMTSEGRFEIRGGAVCVPGEASASRCRRIRPNPDDTYTFIDTADWSAAVMTITRRR